MNKLFFSALLLGASLAPATATAAQAPGQVTVSERISYADLDLANLHGIATLDQRIEGAVRRLCGTGPTTSFTQQFIRRRCRREARAGVAPQRALAITAARRGNGETQLAIRIGR